MPILRQTNFLGGELTHLLWGRTDLEVFGRGLRRMRNFFASRVYGAAVSRPGTMLVGLAGGPTPNVRLLPFVFSDSSSLVLEFGDGFLRFHTNGATVLNGTAPIHSISTGDTEPYKLASPYQYYDLPQLKWAQVGDVLTLTHPSYAPRELRRRSNTNWGPLAADGTVFAEAVFATPLPTSANGRTTGRPVLKSPLPVGDASHPAKEWIHLVTLTVQDPETGRVFETAPWTVTESWDGVSPHDAVALPSHHQLVLYPDKTVTLLMKQGDIDNVPTYRQLAMNVYRGRGPLGHGGVYGFMGSTETDTFLDDGSAPDFLHPPPLGTNPFLITDVNNEQTFLRPASVAFFQERRCFGLGSTLFTSATGDYTDYDRHVYQVAGESLLFELAARRFEQSVHLVTHSKLLSLTKSSVWSIGGVQGGALDFDSVDVRLEEEVGALDLPPLIVEGAVLFARAKGIGVRALAFNDGSYRGMDISAMAQHLFIGETSGLPSFILAQVAGQPVLTQRSLIDWTYAEDPWGLVWAVREDGMLLSFTPAGAAGGAWAWHDTQGWVRSVCAVPEGGEDAVYLAVTRPIAGSAAVTCIERMASRVRRNTVDDDMCVDCAKTYLGAPTKTLTGLTHLAGNDVWVIGVDNSPQGPLTVSAAGVVTLPVMPTANSGSNVKLFIGLAYVAELETLDAATERTKAKITKAVGFEVDETRGVQVGQSFNALGPGQRRNPEFNYSAPTPETKLIHEVVEGEWGISGRAVLRQPLPLPVTVVGLIRELEVGDD